MDRATQQEGPRLGRITQPGPVCVRVPDDFNASGGLRPCLLLGLNLL